MKNVDF